MTSFQEPFAWLIVLLACLCSFGCAEKPNETIRGLQEENKVLREKIGIIEANKKEAGTESQSTIEGLKRNHEDSLTRERELHRSQVAQLEKVIASLRLDFGATQREKLALQEMVEREPRINEAHDSRKGADILVLIVLLGVPLIVLVYVTFRYRTVSDRLNLLTMQQAGELRRIGGDA